MSAIIARNNLQGQLNWLPSAGLTCGNGLMLIVKILKLAHVSNNSKKQPTRAAKLAAECWAYTLALLTCLPKSKITGHMALKMGTFTHVSGHPALHSWSNPWITVDIFNAH